MSVEWVRLQLDLELFEDERFEPYLQGCRQSEVGFTTMADLGDAAGCRRADGERPTAQVVTLAALADAMCA